MEWDHNKRPTRDCPETSKTILEKIKNIIQENPTISISSIAKTLNISVGGIRYHIEKMKASGELERQGGDYGEKWIIKK